MLCPNCHAEAPATATSCPRCGTGLPGVQDDAQTIAGVITPTPAPGAVTGTQDDAQTIAGAVTPATGAGAMTNLPLHSMTSEASRFARPSVVGASLKLEPGDDFGPRHRIESLIGEGGMG